MKKTTLLSLVVALQLPLLAGEAELAQELQTLKQEFEAFKKAQTEQNEALVEEIANSGDSVTTSSDNPYERVSDLGAAASKVYHSNSVVSLGGYGEFKATKYSGFKNYSSDAANDTRNTLETNVVRFIPYIGFRFNDWIVMNTEIEFEDGGARSDGSKNYKYAIVEFSYLDFMFDEAYSLRLGHVLVPFGNINLNHEPTSFLTSDRPLVETFIIPSTWHTNGALMFGTLDKFNYYAGVVTSPDAGNFVEGRFIQQGRLGAKQFTDDFSFVARGIYAVQPGLDVGGSLYYGMSSALAETAPGVSSSSVEADVSITMAEAHVSYKDNGFDVQALAVMGEMGDDYKKLNSDDNTLSSSVNGQYLTVGYDVLHHQKTTHKLYAVGEIERLDMDADDETTYSDNHKFMQYTAGLAYFPDPKVVVKAEYQMKDYGSNATLADEKAVVASLGFIF